MSARYDAVSVGGGLAGCAFALTLAKAGCRVAIMERTSAAQLKVCGDFLSAEALFLLWQLGLDPAALGGHPIETFRLCTDDRKADAPLGFSGLGLSRLLLDETLLERCTQAGITVLRGASAGAIEPGDHDVTVHMGDTALTARHAALATGKHNLRGLPREGLGRNAYKMTFAPGHEAARTLSGVVQLAVYDGGYGGACLVEGGNMTVCWLADPVIMAATGGRWAAQLDALGAMTSALGAVLDGARPLSGKPATVAGQPFGYMRGGEIDPRVYPLGDQLAVIPPLAGDGTSIALMSGIVAAQAMLDGEPAGQFQTRFLRGLRGQFRWARAIAGMFAHPQGRKIAVAAARTIPALSTWLAHKTRLSGVNALQVQRSSSTK